jgi:hypothetical protein
MLTAAVVAVFRAPWLVLAALGGFVAVNAFGYALWSQRDRVGAFGALNLFLLAVGVSLVAALITLGQMRAGTGAPGMPRGHVLRLLGVLVVGLGPLYLVEWHTRRQRRLQIQVHGAGPEGR